MARYTHEAGAQWPLSLIDLTNYKNVDSNVESLVVQIKALQDAEDFDAAQLLIDENIDTLKQYVIDTAAINKYVEEIRNLEIYTKAHKQQIYYQPTEPYLYIMEGDVWIGDIEQEEQTGE